MNRQNFTVPTFVETKYFLIKHNSILQMFLRDWCLWKETHVGWVVVCDCTTTAIGSMIRLLFSVIYSLATSVHHVLLIID